MDIKKKILITGGAGYIGVQVIEELLNGILTNLMELPKNFLILKELNQQGGAIK